MKSPAAAIAACHAPACRHAHAVSVSTPCVHATGEGGLLPETAAALLAVWKRSAGSGRLALPLLRTADLLYTEGGLEGLPPDSAFPGGQRRAAGHSLHRSFSSRHACKHCSTSLSPVGWLKSYHLGTPFWRWSRHNRYGAGPAGELLELVRGEARGCRDVAVLAQVACVLCHLAGAPGQATAERAMQALLTLLANRYPKVSRR
jgi:hypothetical protein